MTHAHGRVVAGALSTLDASALRDADDVRVRAWIHRACVSLAADLRSARLLPASLGTRLSDALLEDAIRTSSPSLDELAEAARAIADRPPIGRVAMILPSNVETAVVRPLVWALLARDAVAMRISSRCPGIVRALVDRLRAHDEALGRALGVLEIDRDDEAGFAALAAWADAIHAWGHDDTIVQLQHRLGRSLVAHGSGLSLAIVTRDHAEHLDVSALARDVARHDQRGCLSPHAVLIEEGASLDATTLARSLFEALSQLEPVWPRGRVEADEAARERTWRDTAQALADWVGVGTCHAVSAEGGALRDTPGLRNVAVHTMSRVAIETLLSRLGPSLKSIGVVEPAAWPSRGAEGPHVVPIGAMQTPSLLAPADGAPPWTGFVGERAEHASPLARTREP
jgi:hypothetical protein